MSRAAREALVREHMESENRHDFDATIATFSHPRYELMASGEIFDGEDEVRAYFARTRAAFPDQRNELRALRQSLADIRRDAASLPSAQDLAKLYAGLLEAARRERRSVLEVSVGIGLAFFNSARHVGRQHLLDPYREDLRPVAEEGLGAYARRVSKPYAEAVVRHLDSEQPSLTERGLDRLHRGS